MKKKRITGWLIRYLDDILILCGLADITAATFMWSCVAGTYILGLCLIAAAVLYGLRHSPGRGDGD